MMKNGRRFLGGRKIKIKKRFFKTKETIAERRLSGGDDNKSRVHLTYYCCRRRRRRLSVRLLHGSRLWMTYAHHKKRLGVTGASVVRDGTGERTGGFGGSHRRAVLPLRQAPHYSAVSAKILLSLYNNRYTLLLFIKMFNSRTRIFKYFKVHRNAHSQCFALLPCCTFHKVMYWCATDDDFDPPKRNELIVVTIIVSP